MKSRYTTLNLDVIFVSTPNTNVRAQVFDYGVNWQEVKSAALPLLQKFTAHTNGANIKMRDSGLAWSYYSTDPEWGQMQAKQLHGELEVGDGRLDFVTP